MESTFTFVIIGLLLLSVIYLLFKNYSILKSNSNISQQQEIRFQNQIAELKHDFNEELNQLKDNHRAELKTEFEKGYDRGAAISKIDVQITPFKRTVKTGNFINRSESYECGYKYQLFSNGLPCLEPKEVIIDSISVKEINEENVNNLLEKFNNIIEKIPNTNLQLGETLNSFKSRLLSMRKN